MHFQLLLNILCFMIRNDLSGFSQVALLCAGGAKYKYAQWRGWMQILKALRTEYPDIVMDHRQSAHAYGPWYQLAGEKHFLFVR
jgi:hypothetical protein